ncbi:hypothetical protein ES702_05445 [subsurface metagenome]
MSQSPPETLAFRTKTRPSTSRSKSFPASEAGQSRSLTPHSEATTATPANLRDGCLICHSKTCQLITHRLLTLDLLRRLSKSDKETEQSKRTRSRNENVLSRAARPRRASQVLTLQRPITPADHIDPFTSFPVKGVNKHTVHLFHEFFNSQGRSLLEFQRELSFDSGHYPYLFNQAFQSSALAMSFVAMAATFHAIQSHGLTSPTHDLLAIHAQAFEELRKRIEAERPSQISEGTIMAAINLCMCCGISFCDTDAALLHWQGVLALLNKPRSGIYSGAVLTFVIHMEHWLVLIAGYKPRIEKWTNPIPEERPPPRKYGSRLESLFASSVLQDLSLSPKISDLCTNTCKATEVLEAHALKHMFNPNAPTSTYCNYLLNVITEQGAIIHNKLHGTDTFAECISLSASLYFILVLRRTPWKAPVRSLCSELRRALSKSKPIKEEEEDDDDDEEDEEDQEINRALREDYLLRKSAYNWMLTICACAATFCQDQPNVEWAKENLEDVRLEYFERHDYEWKTCLVQDLNGFIWSDMFLAGLLQTVCTDWEERRRSVVTISEPG